MNEPSESDPFDMAPQSLLLDRLLHLPLPAFSVERTAESGLSLYAEKKSLSACLRAAEQQSHRGDEERVAMLKCARKMREHNDKLTKQVCALTESSHAREEEFINEEVLEERLRVMMVEKTKREKQLCEEKDRRKEMMQSIEKQVHMKEQELLEENATLSEHVRVMAEEFSIARERLDEQEREMKDHMATEKEWHVHRSNLEARIHELQENSGREHAALRFSTDAKAGTLRVELSSTRKTTAALNKSIFSLSEENDLLINRVNDVESENNNLQQRNDGVGNARDQETRESRLIKDKLDITKQGEERREHLLGMVNENDKLRSNFSKTLKTKDEELVQTASKVVELSESETRLKREYEELERKTGEIAAELATALVEMKQTEEEVELGRAECDRLRSEIHAVQFQLEKAHAEHQEVLARKERELAQAVTNAFVLEGNDKFSIADNLNFDGDLREIPSDRSSGPYSYEEQVALSLSATQISTVSQRTDAVNSRMQELERALENETCTANDLRMQVNRLIETLAAKEAKFARKRTRQDPPKEIQSMPIVTTPQQIEHDAPVSPLNLRSDARQRTQSTMGPIRTHAEDSFRSLSRLLRGGNGYETIDEASSEFNELRGDISSRYLSKVLAGGRQQTQESGVRERSSSSRLRRFLKRTGMVESHMPRDVAVPKIVEKRHRSGGLENLRR